MNRLIFLLLGLILPLDIFAQTIYTISYTDSTSKILTIRIQPQRPLAAPLNFVMPRSIPGSYGIAIYDQFIENLVVYTNKGEKHPMQKDLNDAPRWQYTAANAQVTYLEYQVNLDKMERKTSAADASVVRAGFVGLLNYSVLGWIEGLEQQKVICRVLSCKNWPIFSTQVPSTSLKKDSLIFSAESYASLADGQIFMGQRIRVKEFKGLVPLFVVSYCQIQDEYLDDYGWQGTTSLSILQDYFGELPFQHYSIMLRKVLPLEPVSAPTLAMEHLQSATFFGDTTGLRRAPLPKERLKPTMTTYLHHMGHTFIPLRCYGDTYRPYPLEIPPIINNIWFNEGFIWFLAYDALKLENLKNTFNNNTFKTAPELKKLSLSQLSQLASTTYGVDFRIGRSVYARGALMALEMNTYLLEKTGGKKSMKDVLHYLYQWAKQNQRPFTLEEFPQLLSKAVEVDLSEIYQKWQKPLK